MRMPSTDYRDPACINSTTGTKPDWAGLARDLDALDGKHYRVYRRLSRTYQHRQFSLVVDRVQNDPYTSPSRLRAVMRWTQAGFPTRYLKSEVHKIALCDYVTRRCAALITAKSTESDATRSEGWSVTRRTAFNINAPGQEVLPRSSAIVNGTDTIGLRFTAHLPGPGRRCRAALARQILMANLVELVQLTLLYGNLDKRALDAHVTSVVNQHQLRQQLYGLGLVAFVANRSSLPRESGAGARPMTGDVVSFKSPEELEITVKLADGSTVRGMGIARGITVITGGGFNGKSTLLEALELGVYDHIPGDGRELIVAHPTAVKIRAEDGRIVTGTDITQFLGSLPGGKDAMCFSTENASGSTSMAANIAEALLEVGCKTLLVDADSSATNLLVRDERMQMLIQHEPTTPLISVARAL
nr:hypothetical protein B0A51_03996 [Rachicladosporium sp. CCFEE 5018]